VEICALKYGIFLGLFFSVCIMGVKSSSIIVWFGFVGIVLFVG